MPSSVSWAADDVVAGLVAEGRELTPEVGPQPDTEDQPAVAQVVERHRLPGHLPGPAAGQGVTNGPSRIVEVDTATAASASPASASAEVVDVVPQEEPVPPAASAATASSTRARGSPSSPISGTDTPWRKAIAPLCPCARFRRHQNGRSRRPVGAGSVWCGRPGG